MSYKIFTLMNKNTPICDLAYNTEGHFCSEIRQVWNAAYASPAMIERGRGLTEDAFNAWWRGRAIPLTRKGMEYVLDRLAISDTRMLLEMNHGLSLSDRYWLNDGSTNWSDVNYFGNDFTDDLGMITLQSGNAQEYGRMTSRPEDLQEQDNTGMRDSQLAMLNPSSSLNGNMKKKWAIDPDGTRVMYKKASGLFGLDVYGECVATALFENLLVPGDYVPYEVRSDADGVYAVCPNMLGEDEELVTVYDLLVNDFSYAKNHFSHMLKAVNATGVPGAEGFLNRMFLCDFLIANSDRHYRNFGLIRNVETLEYTRMAPVFDSGNALWGDTVTLNPQKAHEYYAKPFGNAFGEPALELLGELTDVKCVDLNKMKDFYPVAEKILRNIPALSENRAQVTLDAIRHQTEMIYSRS
ncbi:MAG: hypothetical protein LUE29_08285 [Lachnospiraceae bacterium]|nr:hypothetical protein [Lachnospiraceae bacterium]